MAGTSQVNVRAVITAEDRASAVLAGFGNSVRSVGASAVNALKGATVAFGAATAAASAFAVKGAADFEQTRIGLENMLGSAGKARDLLGDISKFAAETPFEFPELAQATRQLVAFGFSASDAFDTMKQLGDVSAAVGAPINDLAYLMGTLRTQGRAFTIDIRQFAMRGIPIYEYLAKVLKVNEQQIAAMIEEGKIGFPQVQKAFQMMTAEGGKFHNTMAKQSKSLSGLWSTLKDNIGFAAREIVGINTAGDVREGSIFDRLRKSVEGLIGFLNKNQGAIINAVQGVINDTITVFRLLFDTISGGDPTLKKGEEKFALFARTLSELQFIVLQVATTIRTVLKQAFDFLKPSLDALFQTIVRDLGPALAKLWNEVLVPMAPVIGTLLVGAVWLLVNVLRIAIQVVSSVITVFSNLFTFFTVILPAGFNTATTFIGDRLTWLKQNFFETVGFIIGYFLTLPLKLPLIIYDAGKKMIDAIARFDWGGAANSIGNAFASMWNRVKNSAVEAWNYISHIDWGKTFINIGKSIGNSIIDLIQGAINGAFAGIPGAPKVRLPHLARGTDYFSGGMALVGERGPELVSLPRGSSITPNSQLPPMGSSQIINVTFNGVFTANEAEMRKLAMRVFEAGKDVAGAKNMNLMDLVGG